MPKKIPDRQPSAPDRSSLISCVRSTIRRYRMFAPGDHVLVGVSGGADSAALLLVLHELTLELDIHLTVAHLNHGLRGEAARREADFVAQLACSLGVPCVCEQRDVRAEQNASGACLQEAARAARYRFFDDVRQRCAAQKLAIGHTMDDQAETVLMRLLRGASTRGLSGIPPVRADGIVRPLICARRAAIERFLEERGCDFIPDTSVNELHYLRNRVRHELLPLISRQYNPRIVEALSTTADLSRADEDLLQQAAEHAVNGALLHKKNMARVPVHLLQRNPLLAGRIVRRMIEIAQGSCRGLSSAHIDAIVSLTGRTGSGKHIPVPGGLVARREYEHLVIGMPDAQAAPFHVQVDRLPADILLPQSNLRVVLCRHSLDDTVLLKRPAGCNTLHVSADSAHLPLVIRSWTPGDRIRPFGSSISKKIKAVFAEHKIPVRQRSSIPVFECGGRIISVGTLCLADHCRVTPECREVIAITVT